jgi:hypothetical protein
VVLGFGRGLGGLYVWFDKGFVDMGVCLGGFSDSTRWVCVALCDVVCLTSLSRGILGIVQ